MTAFLADGSTPPRVTRYHGYPLPPEVEKYVPKFTGNNQYKFPHPDTGKPMGFTRATTLAHVLDDQYGLTKWKLRNLLHGTVLRESEHDRFKKLCTQEAGLDARVLDTWAEKFQVAAGGSEAAEFGTGAHAWLEAVDLGTCRPEDVPDMFKPFVYAYLGGLAKNCLTPIPELRERIVFHRSSGCVGTFDAVYGLADASLALGDLKTSKTLDYSYLGFGIQLAIYSTADYMWDPEREEWGPMPPLRQDFAVLVHVPSHDPESACAVTFDLSACRAALDTALTVRDMRAGAKKYIPNIHALPIPTKEQRAAADLRMVSLLSH